MGIWAFLAIVSFICAFFCPLFPKIIGLAFGALNLGVIITLVVAYFQGLYLKNKFNKDNVESEFEYLTHLFSIPYIST